MPPRHAVHRQLGEPALASGDGHDAVVVLESLERLGRDVVGGVDLALLQRGHHRVGVGEDPEHDPVDRRSRPHQ